MPEETPGDYPAAAETSSPIEHPRSPDVAAYWLAAVVDSADDAVITKTLEGVITSWNPGARRIFGYEAEEIIGQPVTVLIPEDHLDEEPGILARVRAGERIEHYETVRRRKDGSLVDISLTVSPIRRTDGTIIGASKIARDITERTQAEARLRHAAAIIENSDDAIVSKDLDGVIQSWNPGAERLYGYTAAEAVGQPVTMLIPDDRPDEEPGILARIRRGEHIDHYETVRVRKDGSLVDVSLTVSPVRDAAGRVVGASKIARDITGRRRAERTIEGIEAAHMMRKGQVKRLDGRAAAGQAKFVASLFGVAA